jgi:hypothetical protein
MRNGDPAFKQVSTPDPHSRIKIYPGFRASGLPCRHRAFCPYRQGPGPQAWRDWSFGRRLMDSKTKEYALEYALILGVGALLLVLVFVNIHMHIFK